MRIYNTLTKEIEELKTIEDKKIGIYSCGPTVYNFAHIGNLRAYVFIDVLKNYLKYKDFETNDVINITDIGHLVDDSDDGEDKISVGLRREGLPFTLEGIDRLADKYTESFLTDLDALNISRPKHLPRASRHIQEDIEMIQTLLDKGFAYKNEDGIYFDTEKDVNYGKIAGLDRTKNVESRVEASNKKSSFDFAIWKFDDSGKGFSTPFGDGFPGWHIECSAMSQKYLGKTFDIHTGGTDHIPVHHTNEIAQSENANGVKFVNYFMHGAFINISGEKISKSLKNDLYLKDITEKIGDPLAYKYFLYITHYRQQADFTWEAITAANTAFRKIRNTLSNIESTGNVDQKYFETMLSFIEDDLALPKVIATIFEILKDENISDTDKKATIVEIDKILKLDLGKASTEEELTLTDEIKNILDERKLARENKDFTKSDELRDKLNDLGYLVKDSADGQTLTKV